MKFLLLFQLFTSYSTAQKPAANPSSSLTFTSNNIAPDQVIIINTLDGCLHGMDKKNGQLLWSKLLNDPIVSVKRKISSGMDSSQSDHEKGDSSPSGQKISTHISGGQENVGGKQLANVVGPSSSNPENDFIFVPEPAGNGDLYYMAPGQGLKKFDISLREIIENNLGVQEGSFIFTGGKVTSVLAIDPLTGGIIRTFGGTGEPSECTTQTKDAVFIVKTEYHLNIHDINNEKLSWNITYVEYKPSPSTQSTLPDPTKKSISSYISADVKGNFKLEHESDGHQFLNTEFTSPVVNVFDVVSDANGNHLYSPNKITKDTTKSETSKKAYIGNHQGSFYLLSDENFPYMEKYDQDDDDDEDDEDDEKACIPGHDSYPSCLVGVYSLDPPKEPLLLDASKDEEDDDFFSWIMITFGVGLTGVFYFKAYLWIKDLWTKFYPSVKIDALPIPQSDTLLKTADESSNDQVSKLEKTDKSQSASSLPSTSNSGLKVLQVSEKVLGYGSHGTIVLQGSFEGRKVAIKRMLTDFYQVADHEVKILQESDEHPNVVRYFFKEECDGFMYVALECCAGTIADLIIGKDIPEFNLLRSKVSTKQILYQISSGISHLHSLNIVHRDIKPQNILVSAFKSGVGKQPTPRILISDFGLGKRLDDGQSSFHNTFVPGGIAGTVGWRAPECLMAHNAFIENQQNPADTSGDWTEISRLGTLSNNNSQMRITKAIDIFSAGCVFYFYASNGDHPYGERFSREINIMKGNFRLQYFDGKEQMSLLKELIRRMISKDAQKRPTADMLLQCPYFWSSSKQLSFLQDLSDRLEVESREPPSALLKSLERLSNKVIGRDWIVKVNRNVLDDMSKFRKYDGASLQDLLRAIRNKKHHYQDLPPPIQKELGAIPDGFLLYFTTRFPLLVTAMVNFVEGSKDLSRDPLFIPYFEKNNQIL